MSAERDDVERESFLDLIEDLTPEELAWTERVGERVGELVQELMAAPGSPESLVVVRMEIFDRLIETVAAEDGENALWSVVHMAKDALDGLGADPTDPLDRPMPGAVSRSHHPTKRSRNRPRKKRRR